MLSARNVMLSKRHGPYLPEAFSYVGSITYVKAQRTVPGTLVDVSTLVS